jgi:hypothetical protein
VLQRLVDREVCVVELHVLADERDLDFVAALGDPLGQLPPLAEVRRLRDETETLADVRVELLGHQMLRDEVDVRDVGRREHRARVDVGEECDLVADLLREKIARAADDRVGVDPDPPKLVHRVLRRLRLQLAGRVDERDERDVQIQHVLRADLAAILADRLEERKRLDVPDGAPDLGDDDVGRIGRRAPPDAALDLVRDVRNHLHGGAEELALSLLAEHRVPDRAGGMARVPRQVLVDEPLVVPEIEVGLGAVLRDEHLAVLERAHRAGVDVQVRVELLRPDAKAAGLQEPPERGCDDALPECRDDPARDEDVAGARRVAHGYRPSASRSRRTGVDSISAPSERRSPARVTAASATIALILRRPVNRLTDSKPSTAPSAFDPASPSIVISR